MMDLNAIKQLCKHARTDFCAAAGTLCEFCQFDFVFHRNPPYDYLNQE